MARHNRDGYGADQRGFAYEVNFQPDWLRHVKVTRVLQTVAGRMIFAQPREGSEQVRTPWRLRGEDQARRFSHSQDQDEVHRFGLPENADVRHRSGPWYRSYRSRTSVTGPSFTSSTSIIAPNSPVSTHERRLRSISTNRS